PRRLDWQSHFSRSRSLQPRGARGTNGAASRGKTTAAHLGGPRRGLARFWQSEGNLMKRVAFGIGAILAIAAGLAAQNGGRPADGDWPLYSRDLAGTKYSPLAQITTDNVASMTQSWSVRLVPPAAGRRGGAAAAAGARGVDPEGAPPAAAAQGAGARGRGAAAEAPAPPGNPEATPIVVNGVMYLPVAGTRVLALEAETGKELWRHELPRGLLTTARAVAFWPGDRALPARILFTAGSKLV